MTEQENKKKGKPEGETKEKCKSEKQPTIVQMRADKVSMRAGKHGEMDKRR